jgi:hypothetical protein
MMSSLREFYILMILFILSAQLNFCSLFNRDRKTHSTRSKTIKPHLSVREMGFLYSSHVLRTPLFFVPAIKRDISILWSLYTHESICQGANRGSGIRGQVSPVKFAPLVFFEEFNGASKGSRVRCQGLPACAVWRGRKTIRNTPCGQEGICHYRFEKLIVLAYNSK